MTSTVGPRPRIRRWTRLEYERLIELGIFRVDERLELLDGQLVVREPQGSRHAGTIRRVIAALRGALGEAWLIDVVHGAVEVHRDPAVAPDAVYGWRYRDVAMLRPPANVVALVEPARSIPVAALLP